MILIHGYPGTRLGFLNAFLTNELQPNTYDVGMGSRTLFFKQHEYNKEQLTKFKGKKFYIKLSNELLFLHLFLFFEKNVLLQDQIYKQYHYTHRALLDKFYYSAKMWFDDEQITDKTLYDYVVPFDKTYDLEYLIELYQAVNGTMPSDTLLESVKSTNLVNFPTIPDNHSVRVAAELFNFEYKNNYTEYHRHWAINVVAPFDHNSGECLDPSNWADNIASKLTKENYSK